MLGFGGAAVPRRTTLQSSDQIVVQITHMQVPSHRALHEIIDLNDLTSPPFWSRICAGLSQRLSESAIFGIEQRNGDVPF